MKVHGLKKILLSIVVGLLLFSGALFLHYHHKGFQFPDFSDMKSAKNGGKSIRGVKCNIVANLDDKTLLQIKMTIPCKNREQRIDLKRKRVKIKSQFLTGINRTKMGEWVRERDFESIKDEILRIVNTHSKRPVKNLYFESFMLF